MGVVYLAEQTSLGRKVALKLLTQASRSKESFLNRFVREVQTSTRVSHPNVIKIIDYGEIEGQPYYAMEYLDAVTLDETLKRRSPLAPDLVAKIGEQLLDALACVHRAGLIHRDLKPANAMIDERAHVTLMDFGLVKDLDRTPMTAHGKVVGTPGYLPPETILGKSVDGRADMFSLGVMLYELLVGQRPFAGESMQALLIAVVRASHAPARSMRADAPAWLSDFIDRLLAKDPDDRWPNALAALAELRRARGETVERRASEDSIDTILDFTASDAEALPLPQGSIEGGLAELARVAVEPPRKTARTRVEKRATRTFQAVPPAAPPPAAWRGAAPLAVAALAGMLALGVAWRAFVPDPVRPSPPPGEASPAVPAGAGELGARLEAAITRFDPGEKIDAMHADLSKADPKKRTWYDDAPPREVASCRAVWMAKLGRSLEQTGLGAALEAFAPRRDEYFTSDGVPPRVRLALYLKLHDLLDLMLWCGRVRVAGAPDARRALSDAYGMLASGRLAGAPGVVIELEPQERYKPHHLAVLASPPELQRIEVEDGERFFAKGDSREDDLVGALEDAGKTRLAYEYPRELPIPPLDRIEQLELYGVASDLATNNRFLVSLSEDGGPMRDVAVIRGNQSPPVKVVHTLERGLFTGKVLRIGVRLKLIRDMLAWTEYGNFPRVGLRYRLKR